MMLLLALILAVSPATVPAHSAVRQPVSIERVDAVVKRIMFDPAKRPADMPHLQGDEAALTQYDFNCAINVKYDIVEKHSHDGRVEVVAQIHSVQLRLTLDDRIYLPNNANIPLRSHEEGHHVINARVYEESAEREAGAAAMRAMARTWKGSGADEDAAGKAATDVAVQALGNQYMRAVADRAGRIGDEYDEITQHGSRPINISRAVEQAFSADAGKKAKMNAEENK